MTKSSVRISPPLEGRGWGGVFDWLIIRFGQKRLRSCGGKENAPSVHMLLLELLGLAFESFESVDISSLADILPNSLTP